MMKHSTMDLVYVNVFGVLMEDRISCDMAGRLAVIVKRNWLRMRNVKILEEVRKSTSILPQKII
ncbi:uncharacterized protein DS421_11g328190 [Arachis hypogaea]|nr:uncharacterized protein DS421_11g328190 [Arachis hypogaea]